VYIFKCLKACGIYFFKQRWRSTVKLYSWISWNTIVLWPVRSTRLVLLGREIVPGMRQLKGSITPNTRLYQLRVEKSTEIRFMDTTRKGTVCAPCSTLQPGLKWLRKISRGIFRWHTFSDTSFQKPPMANMAVWRHRHYFSVSKLVTSYGLVVLFHKKNVFKLPILKNKGFFLT